MERRLRPAPFPGHYHDGVFWRVFGESVEGRIRPDGGGGYSHGGRSSGVDLVLPARSAPFLEEAFGLDSRRGAKAAAWGAAAALMILPVAWGLQALLAYLIKLATHQEAAPQELVKDLQESSLQWGEQVFMGVLAVLVAPAAEEMLFRGILYPTIKQCGFPRAAWWVTSLLFAGAHFNWLSFLPLTFFSLVLIYLYEKTGSLWAAMTAHSVFNFANFFLLEFWARNQPLLPIR